MDLIYHHDTKYLFSCKGQTTHLLTLHNNSNSFTILAFHLHHSHVREIWYTTVTPNSFSNVRGKLYIFSHVTTTQILIPYQSLPLSQPLPCKRDLIYHHDVEYLLPRRGQITHLLTLHNSNPHIYYISLSLSCLPLINPYPPLFIKQHLSSHPPTSFAPSTSTFPFFFLFLWRIKLRLKH